VPHLSPLGFGAATSAYQVEGAVAEDGRGPSVWDVFTARAGTVKDGSDGSTACDSYHRFGDDLALLVELGVSAYRFSVAWPRIQPEGRGAVEPRGLDYYDAVVDGLLGRGIRPFPTLYHWDLPQPLEDAGGWPSRDTALRFADYAGLVAERLGDRVRTWSTHNEPWCTAFLGYAAGVFAPGRREPAAAYASAHHLLLSHAIGRDAIRAVTPAADVGIVLNLAPVHAEPDGDPVAAAHVDALQNRLWLDPLARGSYPTDLTVPALSPAPDGVLLPGDLERIRGSADWVGVNYYTPFRVAAAAAGTGGVGQDGAAYPGAPDFAFRPRPPLTTMGWEVDPSGLEAVLLRVAAQLPGTALRVTENGAAFADDVRGPDGRVEDADRLAYLHGHVAAVRSARDAGAPVLDYFAWSLLDNFEWAQGYTQTFGLVSVDRDTQARLPKRSFSWYAALAAAAPG
jgi:beta-glucosidase